MSDDFHSRLKQGEASLWIDLLERNCSPEADEIAWALAIAAKWESGQIAEATDTDNYERITRAFLDSRQDLPAPTRTEIDWAIHKQTQTGGISEPDQERLLDIKARILIHQSHQFQNLWDTLPYCRSITQEDLGWAQAQWEIARENIHQIIADPETAASLKRALRILKTAHASQKDR